MLSQLPARTSDLETLPAVIQDSSARAEIGHTTPSERSPLGSDFRGTAGASTRRRRIRKDRESAAGLGARRTVRDGPPMHRQEMRIPVVGRTLTAGLDRAAVGRSEGHVRLEVLVVRQAGEGEQDCDAEADC